MGTLCVGIGFDDRLTGWIKGKVGRTELALHSLSQVLPIDLQFLVTTRALDEQPDGGDLNHAFDLLKWEERGNLNALFLQFQIEELTTRSTVNDIRWHIFATLRTWAAWPSGHTRYSPK